MPRRCSKRPSVPPAGPVGSRIPGGINNVYGPARRTYDPADSVRRCFNAFSPMAMRFVAIWSAIRRQGPAQGASGELGPSWRALTSKAWPRARRRGGGSAPVGLPGAIRPPFEAAAVAPFRDWLRHWGRERTYRSRKPPIGVGNLPTPMTCCLPQCWSAAARTRRHWRTAVVRLGKPARAPAPGPSRGCCGWERGPRPLAPADTAAQRARPPRETGPCVKPGPGLGLRPGQGPDNRAPTAGKPSRVFYGA